MGQFQRWEIGGWLLLLWPSVGTVAEAAPVFAPLQQACLKETVQSPVSIPAPGCNFPHSLRESPGRYRLDSFTPAERLSMPLLSQEKEPAPQVEQGIAELSVPIADDVSQPIFEDNAELDIDPQIIESSPVLQRWLEQVPDIAHDIRHDPAFRTRLRFGYVGFPSSDHTDGFLVGLEDVFVSRTPLTFSAEYARNGRGDRESVGIDARYYLLPLGSYVNLSPVIGYRAIEIGDFDSAGVNIGLRALIIPSRTGAAELSIAQTWIAPGTDREVGQTTFTAAYAVTPNLRIATDIQLHRSPAGDDSRVGILLEWLP